MIILFAIAILFLLRSPDAPTDVVPTEITESELALKFYGKEDPLIATLQASQARGATKSDVIASLPDYYGIKVFDEDITADDLAEHIIFRTNETYPKISASLEDRGFTGQVEGLIIYKDTVEHVRPVFVMTPEAMHNQYGLALVRQITAEYGYAVKISEYEDSGYYESPVKLLTIVLVDSTGRAASDDLIVYWDPVARVFKATNTFGAPGTFE